MVAKSSFFGSSLVWENQKNVQTVRHFCYTNCTNTLKNQEVLNLCAYSTALLLYELHEHIEKTYFFEFVRRQYIIVAIPLTKT